MELSLFSAYYTHPEIQVDIALILNNCYILLSNSSQTLENTKFVASELSLTLSFVLYSPISFHES